MDFHQDYSSHRQYKLSMILNVMDELFAVNLKLYRDTTMYDRRHLFSVINMTKLQLVGTISGLDLQAHKLIPEVGK